MKGKRQNGKGKEKKEFAPNIGFWPTKKGTGFSVFLDENVMETLGKAEAGGRLFLQEVDSDNENAPAYRVTIFPPDDGAPREQSASESI